LVGYLNKYSNWLVYQGKKGASFKPTSYKDIEKNFDRDLTGFERTRLDELRDWSKEYFAMNSSIFFPIIVSSQVRYLVVRA
jgi:hypothetical protein